MRTCKPSLWVMTLGLSGSCGGDGFDHPSFSSPPRETQEAQATDGGLGGTQEAGLPAAAPVPGCPITPPSTGILCPVATSVCPYENGTCVCHSMSPEHTSGIWRCDFPMPDVADAGTWDWDVNVSTVGCGTSTSIEPAASLLEWVIDTSRGNSIRAAIRP